MSAADDAYAEAERMIEEAIAEGAFELSFDRQETHALERLPDRITQLTSLQFLDLDNTSVTDIAPLQALTDLQRLGLSKTGVTDVAPLQALSTLQGLDLSNTGVTDIAPLQALTDLQRLGLSKTGVTDIAPLQALTALRALYLSNTKVVDLRPVMALVHGVDGTEGNLEFISFKGCAACEIDPRIAEIADSSTRAQTLFDYLKDWTPPGETEPTVPGTSPAPIMVTMDNGRMRRSGAGTLPHHDAMTRAQMGWAALKAYRDSFGMGFSVHNYAPLPTLLDAFDKAMGDRFDPQQMIMIGVMGTRIVNLSGDDSFLQNLPDGAETDLRGFAAQISVYVNRFPDWIIYVEEAETNDATTDAVQAEQAAFEEFSTALGATGMVDADITEELNFEITLAAGPNGDDDVAKGLTASTREVVREIAETAVGEVKSGRISREAVEEMDKVADGELAKLGFWTYGWTLVVLKEKQDPLRRLAHRFPARLGWINSILDYLIGTPPKT